MYPDFLHGAPPTPACAAFSKESRMKFTNARKLDRKSGVRWGEHGAPVQGRGPRAFSGSTRLRPPCNFYDLTAPTDDFLPNALPGIRATNRNSYGNFYMRKWN
jgi:hypothetical protein